MKNFKKTLSIFLAIAMMFTLALPTFAASNTRNSYASVDFNDNSNSAVYVGKDITQGKQTTYSVYTEEDGDQDLTVEVYASQASTYSVQVPAVLIVNGAYVGANRTNDFGYQVSATGNIAGDEEVYIEPDETFTMSSIGKDDITGTITQEQTTFTYADGLRYDATLTSSGSGAVSGMTAGLWHGDFAIQIGLRKCA